MSSVAQREVSVDPEDPEFDWDAFIDEHRSEIERQANRDIPAAWVYGRLLNYSERDSS